MAQSVTTRMCPHCTTTSITCYRFTLQLSVFWLGCIAVAYMQVAPEWRSQGLFITSRSRSVMLRHEGVIVIMAEPSHLGFPWNQTHPRTGAGSVGLIVRTAINVGLTQHQTSVLPRFCILAYTSVSNPVK